MSGFSFGLVSRLLKNRFQFCLRAASVSGFQFHPRKLFYCEYELFTSSTSWRFCFITMISSSSDGREVRQPRGLSLAENLPIFSLSSFKALQTMHEIRFLPGQGGGCGQNEGVKSVKSLSWHKLLTL